ncbi:hypothetical protein WJX72_011019 [[Myrmecia] bisecta]|uniref:Sigma 54 modulation/S30EA ribosomal protein C-terminal domain-containing protein n=1 Tax=[Myrmecia] bisecta TaxID=41462 RepID=A0AAW1QSL0_9CHLO
MALLTATRTAAAASQTGSTVKTVIQGRHIELTDSIRSYVSDKLAKAVANYEGAIKEVDVRLSVSGGDRSKGDKKQKTEITIYTLRNGVVRAEDEEDSMYASIDLVSDKVARKLRKLKEKAIDRGRWAGRGGPKGGDTIGEFLPEDEVVDKLPTDQQAKLPVEIVRTKYFFLKPMSLEEATEQAEQVGHDFYVYRDKASDQVQVVYKRKSHGYGVIIPQPAEEASA